VGHRRLSIAAEDGVNSRANARQRKIVLPPIQQRRVAQHLVREVWGLVKAPADKFMVRMYRILTGGSICGRMRTKLDDSELEGDQWATIRREVDLRRILEGVPLQISSL
jgi:hypothetical protein